MITPALCHLDSDIRFNAEPLVLMLRPEVESKQNRRALLEILPFPYLDDDIAAGYIVSDCTPLRPAKQDEERTYR